jgi:hypothetical protein
MNDRVLAGTPEDMRWLPEGAARYSQELANRGVPPEEKEPAVEPELAEDLPELMLTPEEVPIAPPEVPEPTSEDIPPLPPQE